VSAARDLLAGWRAQRARATVPEHADTDAAALAARDIPSEPDASELGVVWNDHEREAMAAYYGGELSAPSYRPTDRDALQAGLLLGYRLRPLPAGHALAVQT
jgi:hypothetical protein